MTHQPLTKAEREELRRLHDYAFGRFTTRINGENDCRVELANGPSDDERGLHARFRYATGAHAFVAIHNHLPRLLADLDAAESERDALKAKLLAADCRDVASDDRPRICTDDKPCGRHLLAAQCFDARQAWSKERAEVTALKAKLAALVDFNVAELGRTRKEVWPDCEYCRDSTHDHECAGPVPNPRWVELSAAIAAARGGVS